MPQQLAFVTTDGCAKIGSSERQLIRRHCMRQKNKQPGSRRSKREAARAAKSEQWDENSSPQREPIQTEDRVISESEFLERPGRRHAFRTQCIMPSPSDWALFPFPEKMDVLSQNMMHQYFRHNPIRDTLYPFKYFGILVDFDDDPSSCFRLLCSEQLCFHAILLLTSASNDLMLRRPLSSATFRHLRRTLPILNERLSDTGAYKNDITLYVISILASIAILFSDYDAAKLHAAGLSEIIRLRGGFGAINYNPVIQFSIDRLNFSSSLVTNLWTPIYDSSVWKEPTFPVDVTDQYYAQDMVCVDGLVEPELATVFRHLQYTAILLNRHYYHKTPVDGTFMRKCLGYVHSRLIELEDRLENDISKCLRLGMMAFLATTFRLPDLHEQHYCKTLANRLELSYAAAKDSNPDLQKTIDIWLVYVLLISADHINEPYIRANLEATAGGLHWTETRRLLKQVMWIDTFHDDLGRKAFEALMKPY